LDESHPPVSSLGFGSEIGKGDRWNRHIPASQVEGGRADHPSTLLPEVDDLAVLNLDPTPEYVGEPEAIRLPQPLQVVEEVRRRLVVVGDPERDRDLHHPIECARRNPRD
jgi:hypothetical protein